MVPFVWLAMAATDPGPAARPSPSAVLSALVEETWRAHPGLLAKRRRWEALQARGGIAGAWMPIEASAGVFENMTMQEVRLMQKLPWPGRLDAASRAAALEAEAARWEWEEARADLAAKVTVGYVDLDRFQHHEEIVASNQRILERFLRVAEAKYRTGQGLQSDVLRAKVELSKMQNELLMLGREREGAGIRLRALLARDQDAPLTPAEELPPPSFTLAFDAARERLLAERPSLKRRRAAVEAAEAALTLAHSGLFPDVSVGVAYARREAGPGGGARSDLASAMLTVPLPFLWGAARPEIAMRERELEEAKAEDEAARLEALQEFREVWVEVEQLRRTLALYQAQILPEARQTVELAEASYQVNKADFLTLLEAQMTLLKYDVGHIHEKAAYRRALAGLAAMLRVDPREVWR